MYKYLKFIRDNIVSDDWGRIHITGFLKSIGTDTIDTGKSQVWIVRKRMCPYKLKYRRKSEIDQAFVFEFCEQGVRFVKTLDQFCDNETVQTACEIVLKITEEMQKYRA